MASLEEVTKSKDEAYKRNLRDMQGDFREYAPLMNRVAAKLNQNIFDGSNALCSDPRTVESDNKLREAMKMLPPLCMRGHTKVKDMKYDNRYEPYYRRAGLLGFVLQFKRTPPTLVHTALTAGGLSRLLGGQRPMDVPGFLADWDAGYNWGSVGLAYLYRSLDYTTKRTEKTSGMCGCVLALLIWSWERLPVGRPEKLQQTEWTEYGEDGDTARCPTVAYSWDAVKVFSGKGNALYKAFTD
ncbi:uncharacterized protein [Aegilops tauschii subsp. strangulata]|uniref:uncharacterized protein n=1 Tax=Aegilops tauschii subsp. strangulata TaxID=200361 RepID=UPI00098A7946